VNDLLARDPRDAPGLLLKGRLLLVEGKVEEAIGSLQTAIQANPASAEAHFALGRAYLIKNDRGRAIEAFNETSKLNPRAIAAQLELSRLELAEGRVDNSIQFAEQARKSSANSLDARLALVRGLIARRDIERAASEVSAMVAEFPDNSAVHTQAGVIAIVRGDQAGATRALNLALTLNEDNLEALNALVAMDLSRKDFAQAISRTESRLARRPDDVSLLLLAARTHGAGGDFKKAEGYLRKTIEVDSANFQAYGMLGSLYVKQGRIDEALKEFDELSKRQQRPVQAHTMAGSLLEAQRKPLEARKRYEQALSFDPDMPVAANNLAWMYAETGENLDLALELAQRAARRLPDHPAVQDTLGWIYYKKGLASLAAPAFQKAIEKEPKNPLFHLHLALAHAKAGDASKARVALQHAIALDPSLKGSAEAQQVLDATKPDAVTSARD
jgi:tetratricopeptide (TPR) repeat protein